MISLFSCLARKLFSRSRSVRSVPGSVSFHLSSSMSRNESFCGDLEFFGRRWSLGAFPTRIFALSLARMRTPHIMNGSDLSDSLSVSCIFRVFSSVSWCVCLRVSVCILIRLRAMVGGQNAWGAAESVGGEVGERARGQK